MVGLREVSDLGFVVGIFSVGVYFLGLQGVSKYFDSLDLCNVSVFEVPRIKV